MKKLFFAVAAIVLASCSGGSGGTVSSEPSFEDLIEEFMEEYIKVPGSYKPISTTELDSAFASPLVDDEYLAMDSVLSALNTQWYKALDDGDYEMVQEIEIMKDSVRICEENYLKTHKNGKFIGWSCDHEFIAKNALGVELKQKVHVLFNKEKTEIVSVKSK